jgi:sugar transferase (PEP-CTERM/EpsH1 system associated)
MNILWVKAGGLLPLDTGGKSRSYHILRALAQEHSVTIFAFYAAQQLDLHPELRQHFSRVECIPLEIPVPGSFSDYLAYLRNLFSLQPYSMAKYCRPGVAGRLRSLVASSTFDVIVCDFVVAAGAIPWEFRCPKVFFSHNVEALIWRRHYTVASNPIWKAVCWREYKLMAQVERNYMRKADHVLTVSPVDRDVFTQFIDPQKITVIPTGVDTDYFMPARGEEQSNQLVFTGSMDWMPNEDAMLYFVKEILPLIRLQIPDVSLLIVGRRPTRQIQNLASRDQGVQVTGTVEDIRPYVKQGIVYVVPLRVGSGTRLKIFEAMAMGKAIVSTSIGAEGLPVTHGENILLAEKPEEFASAVVALLRDAEIRQRVGMAARELVEKKYSWIAVAAVFEKALAGALKKGS